MLNMPFYVEDKSVSTIAETSLEPLGYVVSVDIRLRSPTSSACHVEIPDAN